MRINISDREQFILRVAGLFMRQDSILLHRAENDDFWALPGGACEFLEDTKSALEREAKEELSAAIQVNSLAFTVENFFEYNNRKVHEVGFYYRADFRGESLRFYDVDEFEGIEDKMEDAQKHRLYFKWIPVHSLSNFPIKPEFLKDRIQNLEQISAHIVHRDLK
jgi:ADP-ribose pyrophosphatase YjhB (NUDIX family)